MPPLPLPASVIEIAQVWHTGELAHQSHACVSTGEPALDALLPGGGWPVGAIIEVLQAQAGQHEWRLLSPALAQTAGPVLLVGAPHVPFAPGLASQGFDPQRLLCITAATSIERLWACEQALRCADVGAVLAWLPQARAEQLRRLQIAAADYAKLLFVMRPAAAQAESSPAVLRLMVSCQSAPAGERGDNDALMLKILKRRGPPLEQPLVMSRRHPQLAALLLASRLGAARRRQRSAAPASSPPPSLRKPGDALDRIASTAC